MGKNKMEKAMDQAKDEASGHVGLIATIAILGVVGVLVWFFMSNSSEVHS